MCKWKPEYQPDYECKEPSLGGDPWGYCILHSENEAKDIKAFKEKVEERIATTGDRIDLKGCYFPSGFEAGFLRERRFEKPVDFSEATFREGADFSVATFTKGADFTKTLFQGQKTNFREAKFKGDVTFRDTQFKCEEVSFSDTDFEGEVDFNNPHFADCQVYFIKTHFEKPCEFRWAEFSGTPEAVFEETDLSNCRFIRSRVDKIDFRYCNFSNNHFPLIRKVLGHICSQYNGKDCVPKKWFRRLCYFPSLRTDVLRDELEADKKVEESLNKSDTRFFASLRMTKDEEKLREERYEPVRRLYLELKRNFEDKKDWNTAGDFHYGEMECRRKKMGWLGRNIFSLEAVYYWASGYGERPLRALSWWFLSTLLFFPLLYRLSEHDPLSACVWDSVRVATFMKIGIPIEPESWGRIVLTLQYFICPTLLALFALALRRKVKR